MTRDRKGSRYDEKQPACVRCNFSTSIGYDVECRRHAPIAIVKPNTGGQCFGPKWPEMGPNDWCGDFEWPPEKDAA